MNEIICKGYHYTIGTEYPKGFGGKKFTIKFNSGEVIKTDNLVWNYTVFSFDNADTAVILDGWDNDLVAQRSRGLEGDQNLT